MNEIRVLDLAYDMVFNYNDELKEVLADTISNSLNQKELLRLQRYFQNKYKTTFYLYYILENYKVFKLIEISDKQKKELINACSACGNTKINLIFNKPVNNEVKKSFLVEKCNPEIKPVRIDKSNPIVDTALYHETLKQENPKKYNRVMKLKATRERKRKQHEQN